MFWVVAVATVGGHLVQFLVFYLKWRLRIFSNNIFEISVLLLCLFLNVYLPPITKTVHCLSDIRGHKVLYCKIYVRVLYYFVFMDLQIVESKNWRSCFRWTARVLCECIGGPLEEPYIVLEIDSTVGNLLAVIWMLMILRVCLQLVVWLCGTGIS
jgi:hypothetical protein